jgi:methylmalonyl-CoA carboxyltransferase 1.3S subunit
LKLRITIDGKTYLAEVEMVDEVEPPLTEYAPPYSPPAGPTHPGIRAANLDPGYAKTCQSPVTGLVTKVNVVPGQAVAAGQLLMVLEAMKMETNLTAPRDAVVKSVHAAAGDSVKFNQLLIEFE